MAVFNEPTKWQTSLVNSGDANTIPQTTPAGSGEASFEEGFPQITQVPIGAGGIAPDRKDFNGLFKVLGDWIFFAQNGGLSTYSASFDYIVGRYVVYNNTLYKCIQANGASSTVVAPDSVTPLGSDYWIQVATLADLANFADKDFSNIDNNAKIAIARNSSPSETYDSLTLGASNTIYVAPSDGYVSLLVTTTANNQFISIIANKTAVSQQIYVTNTLTYLTLPVGKGEKFLIRYSGTITLYEFYFTYKAGSKSEQ